MIQVLKRNRRILFLAKLTCSLGLVAYLVWIVDWKQALMTISDANKLLLLIVPFFLLARLGAAAFRWRLILADNKVAFSFWNAYTGYLVGAFYNLLLPGVTGGDAVRIGRCVRQTKCKLGTATASVIVERISGVFVLLSIALMVWLLFPVTVSHLLTAGETSGIRTVAIFGIILILLGVLGHRLFLKLLPHEDARGMWGFIRSGMLMVGILRGRTLVFIFFLSLVYQSSHIFTIFLLSNAIGVKVSLIEFFAIVPIVYLVTFLPISLGGLGVREGVLTFLLARIGVETTDAVTLSFLVYLNEVIIAVSGGLIQLIESYTYNKNVNNVLKMAKAAGINE